MLALGSLGTTSTDPALLQGATTHLARSRSSPVSTSQVLHTKTDWTVKKIVLWENRIDIVGRIFPFGSNASLEMTGHPPSRKAFTSLYRGFFTLIISVANELLTRLGATGALRLLRYKGHQTNHFSLLFVDLEYRIPPLPQSVRSVRE